MKRKEYSSVSIPKSLFKKMENHIEKTGFTSVSDFTTFLFREILIGNKKIKKDSLKSIEERMRALGYM